MIYVYIIQIIIPISKLLGNYNRTADGNSAHSIIPISKLLGNYNHTGDHRQQDRIIPISKLLGNYNPQTAIS